MSRDDYLNTSEAAAYMAVSRRTLARYRQNGEGPKYHKLRGRVIYRRGDIEDYVEARKAIHPVYAYTNAIEELADQLEGLTTVQRQLIMEQLDNIQATGGVAA